MRKASAAAVDSANGRTVRWRPRKYRASVEMRESALKALRRPACRCRICSFLTKIFSTQYRVVPARLVCAVGLDSEFPYNKWIKGKMRRMTAQRGRELVRALQEEDCTEARNQLIEAIYA